MTILEAGQWDKIIRDSTHPDWASFQEAHSRRYSNAVFSVLPLESGKIAVIGHHRTLHAIVDTWEEVAEAAKSIPPMAWQTRTYDKPTKPVRHSKSSSEEQENELAALLGI